MKVAKCHHSGPFLLYCGVAVLVIVNGQPTTDDDIDKDESSRMIDTVEELRAELKAELKAEFRAERGLRISVIHCLK